MRVSKLFATVGAVGLLAGSLVVGQVHADDTTVTVGDAATAIASVSAVIGASAPQTKTPDGFVATVNSSTAEIPKDPSDGLTLTTSSGAGIGIDLPFADTSNDGVKTKSGVVVYAGAAPDVAVAAQPTPDGGMRALVVIDGPQAPTEYRFPLTVPEGASVISWSDGGVLVVAADSTVIAQVAAPWAYDANEKAIPTFYRLDGTTLVQIVRHEGAAYPVVADPSVGFGWNIYVRLSPWEQKAVINAGIAGIGTTAGALLCTAAIVGTPAAVAVCAGIVVAIGVAIYETISHYYNPRCWVELKFSYGLSFGGVGNKCWKKA